ncbi:CHASE2 domain-containing protein [Nostoc sp. PCC 7120 = FACHB-418]|uniref:CHASE2 domain-containing protein n=1 Tax=Anabaena cylindrica FACHB-318 TaxID=2692880 RepID=A0ABR7ZDX4_ANACY|nr:CHASE2 domain-containing protein [Anabaena cylindrica FACHB-318]MBD2261976.1 CHASE2 domain-containing protein [Anabaena sp. FACHB-709]MBD2271881.1 CHASE2 domain-containing protein [Nostoc sp. PCC 7120 = FACHB-418]MBD2282169.1 CHASE2 domain-containing protein [Anabaena cylindrica FACHB-170]MBD2349627.1 CHASE2 domain-containing protein [Trichormus variabilis FACHB-171]HBW33071.1 histidine kinase [Nostoc sp. UBA8866]
MRQIWTKVNSDNHIWRVGITAIIFVTSLRLVGSLQFLEWAAFDTLMQLRPQEKIDQRILIIGMNENDINQRGIDPISDRDIALLLQNLHKHQPAVIGLDIIRYFPEESGYEELVQTFIKIKNLIAVEKILPDISGLTFNLPPSLPESQIGFSKTIIDSDGKQRRSLLAISNREREWKFSFPIKLAETYLKTQGIPPGNVDNDTYNIKFGATELPRFQPNSGGYVQADAGGSQILINFRNQGKTFPIVSLSEMQSGKVNPEQIRGKIILIGMASYSHKDYAVSSTINSKHPDLIYGVEVHAYIVSQLVSAALDNRPMVNVLADIWEYLWIIFWGILGLIIGRVIRDPFRVLIFITIASICLVFICYGLIIIGWWIPIIPAFLTLFFNGVGLAAFHRYDESLRYCLQYRQLIIDQTFDAIHSHPLQTLNIILREVQDDQRLSPQDFILKLQQLNQELRDVYDLVKGETLSGLNDADYLPYSRLDLSQPLDEILFEVYSESLEQNYSYFDNIKHKILKFESMDERNLTIAQKQSLCNFLKEALYNVKKYAYGATRLEVICTQEHGKNIIRVADNGLKIEKIADLSSHSGLGTKLAQNLANQLGGEFKRYLNSPNGVVCQLTWYAKKMGFCRLF